MRSPYNHLLVRKAPSFAVFFASVLLGVSALVSRADTPAPRPATPFLTSRAPFTAFGGPLTVPPPARTADHPNSAAKAFRRKHLLEAYLSHGQRQHPLDAKCVAYLESYLESNWGKRPEEHQPKTKRLADELFLAQPPVDPLVLGLVAANYAVSKQRTDAVYLAYTNLKKSNYGAYVRFWMAVTLAKEYPDNSPVIDQLDQEALKHLKTALEKGAIPPADDPVMADILISGFASPTFTRQAHATADIFRALGPERAWITHLLTGSAHIKVAWDARTDNFAPQVKPEAWKIFYAELAKAESALNRAWKLRPEEPLSSAKMITVTMGKDGAAEMRKWFDRGIAAQVDHDSIWRSMRYGLRPRWHGNHDAMLALGVAAVKTGRFDTHAPHELIHVLDGIADDMGLPNAHTLYRRPDVWVHLVGLYDGYIADPSWRHPAEYWRTEYACVAHLAGRPDVARLQLEALNWQLVPAAAKEFKIDTEKMMSEVAARSGPHARDITAADAATAENKKADARAIYQKILGQNPDQRTLLYVAQRLVELGS